MEKLNKLLSEITKRWKNLFLEINIGTRISIFIALLVLIFGNGLYFRLKSKELNINSSEENIEIGINQTDIRNTKLIDSTLVPYLTSEPILDKGLYIQHYFTEFIIGGANLDSIKVNFRKSNGEKTEMKLEENKLIFEIYDQPYIEFIYKNKFYSIEIFNNNNTFSYSLKAIPEPTLFLTKP